MTATYACGWPSSVVLEDVEEPPRSPRLLSPTCSDFGGDTSSDGRMTADSDDPSSSRKGSIVVVSTTVDEAIIHLLTSRFNL